VTPQAAGFEYRKRCEERAVHLQRFFYEMTDVEPLISFSKEHRYVKYTDPSGVASPLFIDGKTWKDMYINLCEVEEAIGFMTVLRAAAELEED